MDCTPTPIMAPALTLPGAAENLKLLFDDVMTDLSDGRKRSRAHFEAWETLRLRIANDAHTFSHAVNMATATAGQTGATANEQTVSPIRTGTGDTVAAASYPANRAVDVAAAGVSTANEAVAAAIAKSVNDTIALELGTLQQAVQALADSQALIASALSALKGNPTPAAS